MGSLGGSRASFDLGEINRKSVRVNGVRIGNRQSFEAMGRAIAVAGMKPVVDTVFAHSDLGPALMRLESGAHFGKICVALD